MSNSEEQRNPIKKKRTYNLGRHSVGRRKIQKDMKRNRKKKKLKKRRAIKAGIFLDDDYLEEYDPDIQDNILNPKINFFININSSSSEESDNDYYNNNDNYNDNKVFSLNSSESDGENKWSLHTRSKSKHK